MSHDDFAFEASPGLPGPLPRGERVLWQGRPDARRLALDAFGLRGVTLYFAAVILWRATVGAGLGGPAGALAYGLPYLGLWAMAVAVLFAMAWAQARATLYTVTTARVVMRVGAALSVTFNIPYARIAGAALDLRRDGTGSVALTLAPGDRVSYLVLWPHVRPWVLLTQPALRSIPDAARVAAILAEAAETRLSQSALAAAAPAAAPDAAAGAATPAFAAE